MRLMELHQLTVFVTSCEPDLVELKILLQPVVPPSALYDPSGSGFVPQVEQTSA